MEKEFNLSEKIIKHDNPTGFFEFDDVKEFIKRLKDKFRGTKNISYAVSYCQREIDKLAGEKFTQ